MLNMCCDAMFFYKLNLPLLGIQGILQYISLNYFENNTFLPQSQKERFRETYVTKKTWLKYLPNVIISKKSLFPTTGVIQIDGNSDFSEFYHEGRNGFYSNVSDPLLDSTNLLGGKRNIKYPTAYRGIASLRPLSLPFTNHPSPFISHIPLNTHPHLFIKV